MKIKFNNTVFYWSYKKFSINMLILMFVIGLGLICLTTGAKATMEKEYQLITVRNGDTLWTIAKQWAPETDPRITIAKIKEDNQLLKSNLFSGQTLKLAIE